MLPARILIVEDNKGIAAAIAAALHQRGYVTAHASNGKQALVYLLGESWDAIVLDYTLPDMDGRQIIESVSRKKGKMPPFIVSTGGGNARMAVEMMKLGAYDYLIKDPALLDRLPDVIERLLHDKKLEKELMQALDALKKSEQRFRSIVENSGAILLQLDMKGTYTYVSPNITRLLGYEPEEFLGNYFTRFLFPDDIPGVTALFEKAVHKKVPETFVECRIYHKDGSVRYLTLVAKGVFDNHEPYFNIVGRDNTERKQEERKRATIILETEENQKNRFADQLHEDLGPMMSAIKLHMGKIKSLESNKPEDFRIINYMESLVDDVVNKVRAMAGELRPGILLDFGLERALLALLENKTGIHGIRTKCEFVVAPEILSEIHEIIMYRLVYVLLENSVGVASVENINMKVSIIGSDVLLRYSDDRKEYNPDDFSPRKSRNTSYLNICARIQTIGGNVYCSTKVDQGHGILLTMPIGV